MTHGSPVRSFGPPSLQPLEELPKHTHAIVFSPDGAWLVSLRDGVLSIYDVLTSRLLAEASIGEVDALAFDAVSNLWTSSPQGLARWPLRRTALPNQWALGPPEPVGAKEVRRRVTISRDGNTVAAVHNDDHVHVLSADSGKELCVTASESGRVDYLALSPNGQSLATGTWNNFGASIWGHAPAASCDGLVK